MYNAVTQLSRRTSHVGFIWVGGERRKKKNQVVEHAFDGRIERNRRDTDDFEPIVRVPSAFSPGTLIHCSRSSRSSTPHTGSPPLRSLPPRQNPPRRGSIPDHRGPSSSGIGDSARGLLPSPPRTVLLLLLSQRPYSPLLTTICKSMKFTIFTMNLIKLITSLSSILLYASILLATETSPNEHGRRWLIFFQANCS